MDGLVTAATLTNDAEWDALRASVVRSGGSETLNGVLALFRGLNAQSVLIEGLYIDRDFSAAYAAFYASLFEPHLKYCRRWHFFAADIQSLVATGLTPLK